MRPLMLSSLSLMCTALMLGQVPASPPIKMGLWQAEVANTAGSPTAPDGKPVRRTVMSCLTPTNWLTLMGPTAKDACPKVNEVWTEHSYRFELQCPGKPKMATVVVNFDDSQHEHTVIDLSAMPDGTAVPMHIEGQSHWVSSDCGNLSESNPVMVQGAAH